MNFEGLSFSLTSVQWLVMSAIGVYSWFIGRQAATSQEMVDIRTRLTQLEAEVKNMPSQTAVHELITKIERLDANMHASTVAQQGISASLERINNYLLNNK